MGVFSRFLKLYKRYQIAQNITWANNKLIKPICVIFDQNLDYVSGVFIVSSE